VPKGIKNSEATIVEKYMEGAILKIKLVVSLYTDPFLRFRKISLRGCKISGPFRPEVRLFTLIMIPVKKIPVTRARIIVSIFNLLQEMKV
jgi:hypothetical protein